MNKSKQVIQKLKKCDLRATPQRVAVWEYVLGNKSHPTIEDIYENVKKREPCISLATVYNTVDSLVEKGLLQIIVTEKRSHYDYDTGVHAHLHCSVCERVLDLQEKELLNFPKINSLLDRYQADNVQVSIEGICSHCQKKEKIS